jgi:undecaprenyl diphosphate synthase
LGRKDHLPEKLLAEIRNIEEETSNYTRYNFNICIDYGGQDEIIRAVQKMFNSLKSSENDSSRSLALISNFIQELTPATFSTYLDTAGQPYPSPDLIIRTSGEMRTSGLLPFQSVYSELYFETAYLPDFTLEKFELALAEYARRDRRFGSNSLK